MKLRAPISPMLFVSLAYKSSGLCVLTLPFAVDATPTVSRRPRRTRRRQRASGRCLLSIAHIASWCARVKLWTLGRLVHSPSKHTPTSTRACELTTTFRCKRAHFDCSTFTTSTASPNTFRSFEKSDFDTGTEICRSDIKYIDTQPKERPTVPFHSARTLVP